MLSGGKAQEQGKNPISQLNDIRKDCVYELIADQGPTPEGKFTFKLIIDGKTFFGSGPTKKEAKASSAASALKHPAVNIKANRYRPREGPKRNYNKNKQVLFGKKATKEYQDRIADYDEDSGGCQYINGKKVCSLYLNSTCLRGKNCRYLHPEYLPGLQNSPSLFSQVPLNESLTWLQICDNYWHLCCPNVNCKFLHVSRDDEEFYVTNGRIPAHIVEQAVRKALAADKTPGISPCKRYLEGQCSWYSCPFRHVNRKEFSQEVLETLYKHFARRLKPRDDYHIPSRRLLSPPGLDREPHVCGNDNSDLAHGILVEPPMSIENRFQDRMDYGSARLHFTDPNTLLKGMSNLMRDDNYRKEKELHDLQDELYMLREENAMLKNSYRLRVSEEDNFFGRGSRRADFHESEKMYQEQLRRLRKENDEIRRMLLAIEEKKMHPSYPLKQGSIGNSVFSEGFCPDKRPDMRQQKPEMHNFDELLNSEIYGMENQIRYTRLGIPTSLATSQCQVPQQAMQHFAKPRQQQKPVYDTSRMPGKTTQAKARTSYHVNKKSNIAQPKKANHQQNKNAEISSPLQKQQENQKSFLPKKESKQNGNDSYEGKPIVTIEKTNQKSLVKIKREVETRKDPSVERNLADGQTPLNEDVKAEEAGATCNLEHIEQQSDEEIEKREPTDQDDSNKSEECSTSHETENGSNVKSEIEEKSLVVSD